MAESSGSARASLIGSELGGYKVLGLIGRGAMGAVYLASDTNLNRYAALKVLLGSVARDPSVVQRFYLEAQVAAQLKHPNIVRIYSAGIENATPYIVMEYVEGEPLDRFLHRKQRIAWQSALFIGAQVAGALQCAHQRGVIHRDVKPANMILDRKGRVHLSDFGIAVQRKGGDSVHQGGGFIGTPQYLSPEQCAGRALTPSTDLFSLGVILYQMIAGCLPFSGETPIELIRSISTDEPPRLNRLIPEVPDDVARLVAALMEKNPARRPRDAGTVLRIVERLQQQKGDESAWAATLEAFIREQSEIKPRRIVGRVPDPEALRTTRKKRRKEAVRQFGRWTGIAVTAIAFCVSLAGAFSVVRYRPPAVTPAPVMENVVFEDAGRGGLEARLLADGYRVADLSWVANSSVVVARVEGVPGSLTHGASALVAVDPDAEECRELQQPTGPGLDPDYDAIGPVACRLSRIPPAPRGTPLNECLLVYASQFDRGARHTILLPQRWRDAVPRQQVLYRTEAPPAHFAALLEPDAGCAAAVPRPDGLTLCLVVAGPGGHGHYLAERDVNWADPERIGVPVTSADGLIVPESVHYSPSGGAIAYIRERERTRELHVVRRGGVEIDGRQLAAGPIGTHCAFSPDGRFVAFEMQSAQGPGSELYTVSVLEDADVTRLGPGQLGKEPWHPSGQFLLAA
ncbi:MAG: serine/threonine-protein kinase, partial [Candidatus Hydrogenedentes bacterium]|nr:serine/threonine-protein kinase [Candidatus Hydrogenedentota bacterium]